MQDIRQALKRIEQELRDLAWWEEHSPSLDALASSQPFCCDTLSFTQWLQWVLIPKLGQLVEQGDALPTFSAIAQMSEVVFQHNPESVKNLHAALQQLDQLLTGA